MPPPVTKTNSVTAVNPIPKSAVELTAAKPKTSDGEDESEAKEEDDAVPAIDATLEEVKRILVDFVSLSGKDHALADTK